MTEEIARISDGPAAGPRELDEPAARYRTELLAHCYRLLGSAEDAEDAVQETLLRAFRFRDRWEGRSSMRTWLYKIATNVSLDARGAAARRPLPSDLSAPVDTGRLGDEAPGTLWIEPLPGRALDDDRADPASQAAARSGMRLAFVAALQHLSAVQRAVLVLRDVLMFPAADVAGMLDLTVPSVNNHLQRARRRLSEAAPAAERIREPEEQRELERLEAYARAFVSSDVDGLVSLLHEDVTLEMPPNPSWFRGRADVGAFLGARIGERRWRAVATAANTQPAVVLYAQGETGEWRPESLHVLDAAGAALSGIVVFRERRILAGFDLPDPLPPEPHAQEVAM
ncbi:RNA polymerase subunit sigma-70 [Glycomyces tenuis]|uniref:RNA polymerase subunit sigma-70 n=1 Tax=Glycomyces tenuis TaxID=58116 RepID=UPI00040501EC|nr:RNA polymerase subunit sigma-70 [Glycomyces tenuis]